MSSGSVAGGAAKDDSRRSETTDRYLETIYYIQHEDEIARPGRLAEWLGVSAPTVSVSLQRLARDGWLEILPDRSVELTAEGTAAADAIVRRHRILERWLTDVLGLDWATADQEAADLAHGISARVLDRIDAHLNHPTTCPHGNVVPGRRPPEGRRLIRLVDLPPGGEAAVARISEVAEHEAPQLLAELDRLGLVPGVTVTVVTAGSGGDWRITVAGKIAEVSTNVVGSIWVQQPAA